MNESRALALLEQYVGKKTKTFEILRIHGECVAAKAMSILPSRGAFKQLTEELILCAGLLHDIGIVETSAPGLGCFGQHSYLEHGVLGRAILEREGLQELALVCERHTGAGITAKEVRQGALPLPDRDLLPETPLERLICVADKFYSKSPARLRVEKTLPEIKRALARHGAPVLVRFERLISEFELS